MIKRGDIYFIRDTRQSIGSEQKADRPAVIVSNDANNKHSGVYEVVYMTTQPKTDLPTHFITSSALRTSTVLCEQISSVYEERIGEWIGTLTPEEMKQLDECLTVSVGINTKTEKEPAEMESLRQQLAEMADRQQVAEKQAKTYKGLQGYSDADFEAAAAVQKKNGRYTMALYKQAGNSIPVTIFESIFRKIILGETAEKEASNE